MDTETPKTIGETLASEHVLVHPHEEWIVLVPPDATYPPLRVGGNINTAKTCSKYVAAIIDKAVALAVAAEREACAAKIESAVPHDDKFSTHLFLRDLADTLRRRK